MPVSKGDAVETKTGSRFAVWFVQHDAALGESPAGDCFITLPRTLADLMRDGSESGLLPPDEFRKRFES